MSEKNTKEENIEELSEENLTSQEETVELTEEERLTQELAEQKDKFVRLFSDFENFRRRTAKEKIDNILNATSGLIKELLPVLDDFERAQSAFETATDIEPVKEGVELVYSKLKKTLEAKGLKAMDSKETDFDVELHECITQFDGGEDKKGKVIDVVEKGYFLNDKVVRYAKVVVGS
ncbi:nucleotide exchange factor GrpE [Arcticibacterium luteifluviistationis]|uniref:Protein GrpE n=1 Tax=Arcticibacterium luteifluviistationis TaxID=1784714 RepID=A0A2Z4G6Z6_9BACT|nr:nucleotide exchange factor GrpE [Arcticibacterium luteifluviistationis]AWV96937.1 nucleotide exchange factor GrpE [Arcticibacterium luteifluviistationis]